jgi:hypothetical protein
MFVAPAVGIDGNNSLVSDEQQAPIISTLEKREDVEKENIHSIILPTLETIVPITIDIDPKPIEASIESKIVC